MSIIFICFFDPGVFYAYTIVGKVQVDAIRARLKGVVVYSGLGRKDESEWGRDLEPCPPHLYHTYY